MTPEMVANKRIAAVLMITCLIVLGYFACWKIRDTRSSCEWPEDFSACSHSAESRCTCVLRLLKSGDVRRGKVRGKDGFMREYAIYVPMSGGRVLDLEKSMQDIVGSK
jgi:hypothetical protein